MENKLLFLDIVNHEERLNEEKREEILDKELMTEADFLRYYGRADDGHKRAN